MNIKDAAEKFSTCVPEKGPALRRITLALEREKIRTLEQLDAVYRRNPETLLSLRGIGPRSMTLIGELIAFFGKTDKNLCGQEKKQ